MTEKELHAEALRYHSQNGAGKLEICPTKPVNTPEDLSLAYSPGVAAPSPPIPKKPDGQRPTPPVKGRRSQSPLLLFHLKTNKINHDT